MDCDDGVDNDADGRIDWDGGPLGEPADQSTLPSGSGDPGCGDPLWATESPMCQDGVNNDGDGKIDYDAGYSVHGSADPAAPDPECVGKPWQNREAPASSCGLSAELTLLLPPLLWLWQRRRRPSV